MQTKQIVEAIGLVKAYGRTNVVDGVSFSVGEGEIFGILGPNGAGKTTTLEMLKRFDRLTADKLISTVLMLPNSRRKLSVLSVFSCRRQAFMTS